MLNGVGEGLPLSIGDASDLEVILITNDENGFDTSEAAVLHYRVKAGEAEISRGSVLLPDITPFGQQYFWSGSLDLMDSGATTLLPSYTVDVWVSGSDEAGNPLRHRVQRHERPLRLMADGARWSTHRPAI